MVFCGISKDNMTVKRKKIIFTGGGSAGHVTPNLALIEKFLQEKWEVIYIGSYAGIERELITKVGVPYYAIATGKFRRYFSWQNFIDPWKILYGIWQAIIWCYKLKPNVVFSKGGFVSFPVVIAAWFFRIPVVIHESDLTVGLANKLCFPFASKICITFSDTIQQIKNREKALVTGTPIRKDFFAGDAELGRKICGFSAIKKIIVVFGGSLGAEKINKVVRQILPEILSQFQVVHVCGKNKIDSSLNNGDYKQFEYLHEEFPHILAASSLVVARSGANSIYELIALRKPNILLPLATNSSRGDQLANAQYCVAHGFSEMIRDEELTPNFLLEKIKMVDQQSRSIISAMEKIEVLPATAIIYGVIENASVG